MQQKFLKNLLFVVFINLLIKPIWIFGIDRSLQNIVGAEQYGTYYALFNLSFLFNIILDLGFNNFTNRTIAQNANMAGKYLSAILNIKLLLTLVYILATIVAAYFLRYNRVAITLLSSLLVNQVLNSFVLYVRANIAGLQMLWRDSVLSALDKLVAIVLCLPLFWVPGLVDIQWYIHAQTAGWLATLLLGVYWLYGKGVPIKISFDTKLLMVILRQSYPYALLSLLMMVYTKTDAVLLERMLPDGALQTGIYAGAYRLYDAANIIAFLFSGLLFPLFAKSIRQKLDVQPLVGMGMSLLVIPSIIFAMVCVNFNRPIMELLYTQQYDNQPVIFALLMCSFIAVACNYIFGTLLTANGSMKTLNILAASMVILNIGINLGLIPHYKAMGTAIATLATQSLVALVQILACIRIFHLKVNTKTVLSFVTWLLLSLLIGYYIISVPISWLYVAVCQVAFSGLLAIALGLIPIKNMIKLLKSS